MSERVIGWRLDLVRNQNEWKGAAYAYAKSEFFSLITKATYGSLPIMVSIYMDGYTLDKFYRRWLEDAGVDENRISGVVNFIVFDVPNVVENIIDRPLDSIEMQMVRDRFELRWIEGVEKIIDEKLEGIDGLYSDAPPYWVCEHQQTQSDSIIAVWFDHQKLLPLRF